MGKTRKVRTSITMDPALLEAVKAAVANDPTVKNVSKFIERAVEQQFVQKAE